MQQYKKPIVFLMVVSSLFLIFFVAISSTAFGFEWAETLPAGISTPLYYWAAASDSDGSTILVGTEGRLYISTSSGTTWAEARPAGDIDKYWHGVASNGDGSTLLSAVGCGRLYISTSSGATWTEK